MAKVLQEKERKEKGKKRERKRKKEIGKVDLLQS